MLSTCLHYAAPSPLHPSLAVSLSHCVHPSRGVASRSRRKFHSMSVQLHARFPLPATSVASQEIIKNALAKQREREWDREWVWGRKGDSCRRICRYFAVCAFRLFDKYKTHFHPGKRQWTVQTDRQTLAEGGGTRGEGGTGWRTLRRTGRRSPLQTTKH